MPEDASFDELMELAKRMMDKPERGQDFLEMLLNKEPAHLCAKHAEEIYTVAMSVVELGSRRYGLVLTDSQGLGCALVESSDQQALKEASRRANRMLARLQERKG